MRLWTVVGLIVGLVGCAHRIPPSYHEQCALDGLVFKSMTSSSSGSLSYAPGIGLVSGSSRGEAVQCDVPINDEEKCRIERYQESYWPKRKFNQRVPGVNLLMGLGYMLYVLPGAVFYFHIDRERERTQGESDQLTYGIDESCKQKSPETPPGSAAASN